MIKKFEDLGVWKDSRILCTMIYDYISRSEFSRDYALTNQINRSSASVMDNIAEGFGRSGNKEFIQFLSISKASCNEVKSQLYRALDRKYITPLEIEESLKFIDGLINQLGGFINYLKKSEFKGTKFMEPSAEYGFISEDE